jgi:heme-degrading monooxygenase HmoA
MSIIVVLRVPGDPAAFERYANANSEQVTRIAQAGRAAGAAHHMFAAGDGEIVVVDEWDSAENFQAFFAAQTEIPELMRAGGATGDPQISFFRKIETPDAF